MQKMSKLAFFPGILLACSVNFYSANILAQAQVVEAGSSQGASQINTQGQNQSGQDNSQTEIMMNMYMQLEALQNEMQDLRGLVEQQSYQVRRLQTEQRDRYLDTDSRLSELNNQVQNLQGGQQNVGIAVPPVPTSNSASAAANSNGFTNNPVTSSQIPPIQRNDVSGGAAVALVAPRSEQELYREALNLLLEDEAFAESITLFQQYLEQYPQGRYLTNTLYWQGAAMELAGRYPQAIVVLQRLINEFPADAKAPTAILRLGTVYREMGDNAQATFQWQRISELYPESTSEIGIANEYLSELTN